MTAAIQAFSAAASTLLVAAGVLKLGKTKDLHHQIVAFDILPKSLVGITATILAPLEVLSGGASLLGNRPALAVASLLYLGFSVAIAINLIRGRSDLKCGCFGSRGKLQISWLHVSATLGGSMLCFGVVLVQAERALALTAMVGVTVACIFPLLLALKDLKRVAAESQIDWGVN